MTTVTAEERTAAGVAAAGAAAWVASLVVARHRLSPDLGPSLGAGPGGAGATVVLLWAAAAGVLTWLANRPGVRSLRPWVGLLALGLTGLVALPVASRPAGEGAWLVVVGSLAVAVGGGRGLTTRGRALSAAVEAAVDTDTDTDTDTDADADAATGRVGAATGRGDAAAGRVGAATGRVGAATGRVRASAAGEGRGLALRLGLGGGAIALAALGSAAAWGLAALDLETLESAGDLDGRPFPSVAVTGALAALAVVGLLAWWVVGTRPDARGWERGTGPRRVTGAALIVAAAAAVVLVGLGTVQPSDRVLREPPADPDEVDCCLDHDAVDAAQRRILGVGGPASAALLVAGLAVAGAGGAGAAGRVRGAGTRPPGSGPGPASRPGGGRAAG